MYGASWNYERMQNLGFLYTILPTLKKIYKDKKEKSLKQVEDLKKEFNFNPTLYNLLKDDNLI